ncbi:prenyltransferase/squalene oxidase repeat-containing protein [Aeoliella sp.]|uniref:prenyltransferase/squalene oxidase repeat-containing protein n=1 Tax=Aeoliella sp. TaxID=2795800 RepID=UPI003CCC3D7F
MPTADLELDYLQRASVETRPDRTAPSSSATAELPPEPQTASLIDLSAWMQESPPWLISAVVHMVALIVLGLLAMASVVEAPFLLNARYGEELGEIDLDSIDDLNVPQDVVIEQSELAPNELPEVVDPLSMPDLVPLSPDGLLAASDSPSISVGLALSGRNPGMREALRDAYGGTALTDQAVMEGLRWLARQQRSNGSWSLRGPYRDGGNRENREAATAMALLAFQGHGHTHKPLPGDEFPNVVARGWNWLLAQQYDDGHFYGDVGDARLYTHAQCTIAICELYAMTRDEDLRKPAQKAVDYCVKYQTSAGGWRYEPGRDEDLSVTGWFAMALQSARMAGLEVPSETFQRLSDYLDTVQHEYGSRYSYRARGRGATPAMTAEGLLCRQYLGWERDDQRLQDGVSYLLKFLPEWDERNVYHWYYATQVMHHMEGKPWREWNNVMRQLLPEQQEKRGRERGSWDPNGDRWGSQGGRLFTTCLSIYMLEVYYRHLPLYSHEAAQ